MSSVPFGPRPLRARFPALVAATLAATGLFAFSFYDVGGARVAPGLAALEAARP